MAEGYGIVTWLMCYFQCREDFFILLAIMVKYYVQEGKKIQFSCLHYTTLINTSMYMPYLYTLPYIYMYVCMYIPTRILCILIFSLTGHSTHSLQ